MHVPGMPMKHLYVIPNAAQPRNVVVGGRWDTAMCLPESVLQAVQSVTGGGGAGDGNDDAEDTDSDAAIRSDVLYDTFPLGQFEVTFEVPMPFDPLCWFTHYSDGVLAVIWVTTVPDEEDGNGGGPSTDC